MSILALQKKLSVAYRIRLGKRDGNTPTRLINEIRVTSTNRKYVVAFADVYGGRPKRWSDGDGYEVYLPISSLPVTLVPGQTLKQDMELWAGSTCQRRCDSVTMTDGKPCACGPDLPIEERECKPVSRLTVACPEVAVAGVGMLVTRSVIAAGELMGAIDMIQPILDAGRPVNGILRIDQLVTPGNRFAVPRLEIHDLSFAEIQAAAGRQPALGPAPAGPLALEGGE